ncbi:MAG: hypothetical protein NTV06_03055 [candidate division Zixibacteria bacterium]|nr:hypothetical protein [candidate division Zixibacteria bacterium]
MRLLRYSGAFALTLILLILSHELSSVRSVDIKYSSGGLAIKHRTVPKIIDGEPDKIKIRIHSQGKKNLEARLYWTYLPKGAGHHDQISIDMVPMDSNLYAATIPLLSRGRIIEYHINISDTNGNLLARIPKFENESIKLKYQGGVPIYIVVPHISLMFIAVYLAVLALFDAFKIIRGDNGLSSMAGNFRWATVSVFLGGYPFGWAMNYFAFGTIWEGIPFGWDFTDNKTQIVLLYLIMLNLSTLGTLYKNRFGINHFSDKTLGWLGILGFILILGIYIIPHSIQFSIAATALFSYGLTALIVALYTYGWTKKRRWIETNLPK